MRLAYLVDGRSPIALNWIRYMVQAGHEVHLISTTPAVPQLDLAGLYHVPVAFSGLARSYPSGQSGGGKPAGWRKLLSGAGGIRLRTLVREWVGPGMMAKPARDLRVLVDRINPDLVHAMRIPFEGMLATEAGFQQPLMVSIWGNDFTLHANASPGMRRLTRRVLQRCDGLHSDCKRDLQLARDWGWTAERLEFVLPGNGGIRADIFHAADSNAEPAEPIAGLDGFAAEGPLVVNPRGFRGYVRNDTFFQAAARVHQNRPEVVFVCPTMAGESRAIHWLDKLDIHDAVRLLPRQTPRQMAALFRRAQVTVSPSEHDGTPNTLLEGMACGCFPVAGRLDSIEEWIEDGKNGLLIDPADPQALAEAILQALSDTDLRRRAAELNAKIIAARAGQVSVMRQAQEYYQQLLG